MSLLIDARGSNVPVFLHWGADLGDLDSAALERLAAAQVPGLAHSSPDVPLRLHILPLLQNGWQGRPALVGSRAESADSEPFRLDRVAEHTGTTATLTLVGEGLEVSTRYALTPEGLLVTDATLTNRGPSDYRLAELSVTLPLSDSATEALDFGGHWAAERLAQRWPLGQGAILRESRHGRPGHDASYLFAVGAKEFAFRTGEVWAAHLGWSGNQRVWADHQSSGLRLLGLGELLAQDEVVLVPSAEYRTPSVFASYSDAGLDAVSTRFHNYLRRVGPRPALPRRVILNTWEATYFAQEPESLTRLADAAAAVGIERFVLDDGWMSGRVDDAHGLGDWTVDARRWPEGLGPLIEHVRAAGMDFGLWVEPEMANPDSATLQAHPEWILTDSKLAESLTARNQVVVNLALPEAFDSVLDHLDALLTDHPISYLKWDHNRDLFTTATREQTLAVYRLMDRLAERHPDVEIESCASGGGRIDFGMLARATRVWASDNNDPLDRQRIYRWSSLLVPPELLGVHVGAATSHTTGRTHSLSFRLATALFGWAGIEQDLTKIDEAERQAIVTWLACYQQLRPLLHSGTTVRADRGDSNTWVHGIVAADRSDAVFAIVAMSLPRDAVAESIRFPGLDPDRRYEVTLPDLGAAPSYFAVTVPEWISAGHVLTTGRVLATIGLAAPPLAPEQALVVRVREA